MHLPFACRCHVHTALELSDEVGISFEVEFLLSVVFNSSEGTLTNALASHILRFCDLFLDAVGVVMVDLLESNSKSIKVSS